MYTYTYTYMHIHIYIYIIDFPCAKILLGFNQSFAFKLDIEIWNQ